MSSNQCRVTILFSIVPITSRETFDSLPKEKSVTMILSGDDTAQDVLTELDKLISNKYPGKTRENNSELFYFPPTEFGEVTPPVHIPESDIVTDVPEIAERLEKEDVSEANPVCLAVRPRVPTRPHLKAGLPAEPSAAAECLVAEQLKALRDAKARPACERVHWSELVHEPPSWRRIEEALNAEEEALLKLQTLEEERSLRLRGALVGSRGQLENLKKSIEMTSTVDQHAEIVAQRDALNEQVEQLRNQLVDQRSREQTLLQRATPRRAGHSPPQSVDVSKTGGVETINTTSLAPNSCEPSTVADEGSSARPTGLPPAVPRLPLSGQSSKGPSEYLEEVVRSATAGTDGWINPNLQKEVEAAMNTRLPSPKYLRRSPQGTGGFMVSPRSSRYTYDRNVSPPASPAANLAAYLQRLEGSLSERRQTLIDRLSHRQVAHQTPFYPSPSAQYERMNRDHLIGGVVNTLRLPSARGSGSNRSNSQPTGGYLQEMAATAEQAS